MYVCECGDATCVEWIRLTRRSTRRAGLLDPFCNRGRPREPGDRPARDRVRSLLGRPEDRGATGPDRPTDGSAARGDGYALSSGPSAKRGPSSERLEGERHARRLVGGGGAHPDRVGDAARARLVEQATRVSDRQRTRAHGHVGIRLFRKPKYTGGIILAPRPHHRPIEIFHAQVAAGVLVFGRTPTGCRSPSARSATSSGGRAFKGWRKSSPAAVPVAVIPIP